MAGVEPIKAQPDMLSQLASLIQTLGPTLLGSGKTTTTKGGTETDSGKSETTTMNPTGDAVDMLHQVFNNANGAATGTDDMSGLINNIMSQAAMAFAPNLSLETGSGMYNTSMLKMLQMNEMGKATAQATDAVLKHQTAAQQIQSEASRGLLSATTGRTVTGTPTTRTSTGDQTSQTAPVVNPTASSAIGTVFTAGSAALKAPDMYNKLRKWLDGDGDAVPKADSNLNQMAGDQGGFGSGNDGGTFSADAWDNWASGGGGTTSSPAMASGPPIEDGGGGSSFFGEGGEGVGTSADSFLPSVYDPTAISDAAGSSIGDASIFTPPPEAVTSAVPDGSAISGGGEGAVNPFDFDQYRSGQDLVAHVEWDPNFYGNDGDGVAQGGWNRYFSDQNGTVLDPGSFGIDTGGSNYSNLLEHGINDGTNLGDTGLLQYGIENNNPGALIAGGTDPTALGVGSESFGFDASDFSDYSDYVGGFDFSAATDAASETASELAAEGASEAAESAAAASSAAISEFAGPLGIAYGAATTFDKAWIVCTELVRQKRMPYKYWTPGTRRFLQYPAWIRKSYYALAVPSVRHLRKHPTSLYSKILEIVFNWRAENIAAVSGIDGAKRNWKGPVVTAVAFAIGCVIYPFVALKSEADWKALYKREGA